MGAILNNVGSIMSGTDSRANAATINKQNEQDANKNILNSFGGQLNKFAQGDKGFDFGTILSLMAPKEVERRSFMDMTPKDRSNFLATLGQSMIQNNMNNKERYGVGALFAKSLADTDAQDIAEREKKQNQIQQLLQFGTNLAPAVSAAQRGVEQLGLMRRGQDLDESFRSKQLGLQERELGLRDKALGMRDAQDKSSLQLMQQLLGGSTGNSQGPSPQSQATPDSSTGFNLMKAGAMLGNPGLLNLGKAMNEQERYLQERQDKIKDKLDEREYEKKEKPLSGESASKLALVNQGIRGIDEVKKLAFDKDGSLNRSLIAQISAGTPTTPEAKKLYTALYNMTAAKLRLDTGAAASESEVKNNMAAFAPALLDNSDSAHYKLDALKSNLGDFANIMGRPALEKNSTIPQQNQMTRLKFNPETGDFE